MSASLILRHDCDLDEHSFHVIGPFDTADEAERFIERHQLWLPSDGGYAFAVVIADNGEFDPTPPIYWEDEDDQLE
jgi:hypothetical protein